MTVTVRPSPASDVEVTMRVVSLEEHFLTSEFLEATGRFMPRVGTSPALEARLLDLDETRIAAMDEAGVDVQVLSLAAGGLEDLAPADGTALVRLANDAAHAATMRHPGRFKMFANLALKDPESAAQELYRGVRELGCVGGFLNGTEGGSFLDDPRYTPVFAAAEELDVALYLHPTAPPPIVRDAYFSGLPESSAYFLSTAGWGWHAELGMHCLRMILGGVFDRHPRLRMIIGHLGENLPYSLIRAQDGLPTSVTGLHRTVRDYFLEHFSITTSGYFTAPPFLCARDVVGTDRLLFSVDYPYRTPSAGTDFLRHLPIPTDELARVAATNAERVLKIEPANSVAEPTADVA